MRNRVYAILVFLCAFSLYAQIPSSPYGKILTLDNSGTQQWIDISTVMTTYFDYHPSSAFPAWLTNGNSLNSGDKFGSTNNQPLIFITNNTERARITESGYVGIGTTNPQEALDINGNVRFSGALMPNGSAGTSGQVLTSQGAGNPPQWVTVNITESDPVWSTDKTGNTTITGNWTFTNTITGNITGNAGTVTNGVYTNGSYSDPGWITSLSANKISGTFSDSQIDDNLTINGGTITNTSITVKDNVFKIQDENNSSKEIQFYLDNLVTPQTLTVPNTSGTILLDNTGWTTSGNSLSGTEKLGSTSNHPVTFITNNTDRFRFTTKGQIEVLNSAGSVFLGEDAGANQDNSSYRYNVFVGYQAGYSNTTGYFNTATGFDALSSNTTGNRNTANGVGALLGNTTGYRNTATGFDALYFNTTGNQNTATGFDALSYNTTGNDNTANGVYALRYNTTGGNNVALGYYAGYGSYGVNFNQCTFVGANSYPATDRTNVTMLGYGITNAECTGDNQVLLGNTSITQIRAQVGTITTYSDGRYKINVKEDVHGLDFVMKLRPVTFNKDPRKLHQIWGTPDSIVAKMDVTEVLNQRHIGLIAQEVDEALKECGWEDFPGIDRPRNEKEVYTLRYGDFILPMIKSIQEQQKMIEEQSQTIEELKKENEGLRQRLEQLERIVLQGQTSGNENLGNK